MSERGAGLRGWLRWDEDSSPSHMLVARWARSGGHWDGPVVLPRSRVQAGTSLQCRQKRLQVALVALVRRKALSYSVLHLPTVQGEVSKVLFMKHREHSVKIWLLALHVSDHLTVSNEARSKAVCSVKLRRRMFSCGA